MSGSARETPPHKLRRRTKWEYWAQTESRQGNEPPTSPESLEDTDITVIVLAGRASPGFASESSDKIASRSRHRDWEAGEPGEAGYSCLATHID